jgi:S1-C subfamily serine protease
VETRILRAMCSSPSSPARPRPRWIRFPLRVIILAGAAVASAIPGAVAARARPGDLADGLSGLYERVSPAVVRVISRRVVMQSSSAGSQRVQSAITRRFVASGIVIAERGCVVTTDRVAQPGDSVIVQFPDGTRMDTDYIGHDASIHISVLHLRGRQPFFALAPSRAPVQSLPTWVAAVAYGPWSEELSRGPSLALAQGTAVERVQVRCADSLALVWRLRAPLYPGNAGGALLTLDGEWLGLITGVVAGEAPGGGLLPDEGVIIPADLVSRTVARIESGGGSDSGGFLGVRTYRRPVTASDSLWRGIGVIVSEVLPGGPAERYGIRPGDVILRFGEVAVEDASQLTQLVREAHPGTAVQLEILRAGQPSSVRVYIGDMTDGELQALTRRRDEDRERDSLKREVTQTEQRLGLLRQRLELLETGSDPSSPGRRNMPGFVPN